MAMEKERKITHPKPQFIVDFKRPTGTEIKHINGYWYLYERSSYWDPQKGCTRKKSGKLLGKITENGLVLSKSKKLSEDKTLICLELGATSYLVQKTTTTKRLLIKYFPDEWKVIYTIALLKAKKNNPLTRIESRFYQSALLLTFPRLNVSIDSIQKTLLNLSLKTPLIKEYMREEVKSDITSIYQKKALLIDAPFEERKELEYIGKEMEDLIILDKSEAEICSAYKWRLSDIDYYWMSGFDDIILDDQNMMDELINQQLINHTIKEDKLELSVQGIEIVIFLLNFISIKTVDAIINGLDDLNLLDHYPYPELIYHLETIKTVHIRSQWKISKISKEASSLCSQLKFKPKI